MAQGNLYLLVPTAEKDNQVPAKLRDKWQFQEPVLDPNTGEPTGETITVHPSWLGAANRLRKQFGVVRELTYNNEGFQLIELELSWVDGEVQEVEKLQSQQAAKRAHYRMLTNTEAKGFIKFCNGDPGGVDPFQ